MKLFETTQGSQIFRLGEGVFNSYAIVNKHQVILIDAGVGTNAKTILSRLATINPTPNNPLLCICTHAHVQCPIDVSFLRRRYPQLLVAAQEAAVDAMDMPQQGRTGIGGWFYGFNSWIKGALQDSEEIEFDMILSGCEALDASIQIKHTPGHTAGCISVIVDDEIAVVGDLLLNSNKSVELPGCIENYSLLAASWEELLKETRCHTFFPGQGDPVQREDIHKGFRRYFYGR